jgi:hypothetical protein
VCLQQYKQANNLSKLNGETKCSNGNTNLIQVLKQMGEFLEVTFGTTNEGHEYVDNFQFAKIREEGFGQVY